MHLYSTRYADLTCAGLIKKRRKEFRLFRFTQITASSFALFGAIHSFWTAPVIARNDIMHCRYDTPVCRAIWFAVRGSIKAFHTIIKARKEQTQHRYLVFCKPVNNYCPATQTHGQLGGYSL